MSSAIEERSFIFAEPDLYEMVACHRDDIVMRTIRECKRKSNGTVDKAQAPSGKRRGQHRSRGRGGESSRRAPTARGAPWAP